MKKLFSFQIVSLICTGQNLYNTMNKELKVEVRAYIKGRVALCIPPKQIYKELSDIHGNSRFTYMTICRWIKKNQRWFIQHSRWPPFGKTKHICD